MRRLEDASGETEAAADCVLLPSVTLNNLRASGALSATGLNSLRDGSACPLTGLKTVNDGSSRLFCAFADAGRYVTRPRATKTTTMTMSKGKNLDHMSSNLLRLS